MRTQFGPEVRTTLAEVCRSRLAPVVYDMQVGIVGQISGGSDRIAVMYRGRICEIGTAANVLAPPHHPYTRVLLASAEDDEVAAEPTAGSIGVAAHTGCVFAARCPHKLAPLCDTTPPLLRALSPFSRHCLPSQHPSQRRGAGDECRRRDIPRLELSTSKLQHATLALYRQVGYLLLRKEVAETASNKTVGGGIRRYYFAKTL
jgi:oligopeptide/dipeptide ABC transporter ATP-binding protein